MTKQEFEAKAADLKGNIAELLGISADRIKVVTPVLNGSHSPGN